MSKVDFPPHLMLDGYKLGHPKQFPKNTTHVYSTWIPRESRIDGIDAVVAFGFQAFIKEFLIDDFNENFFSRDVEEVCAEYERVLKYYLADPNPDSSRIRELHSLGYMPIEIRAVEEGTLVPLRVPMLTIENTHPSAFWLTNSLETVFSTEVWQSITTATIARQFRRVMNRWARVTGVEPEAVNFQGHDFSMRGMVKRAGAAASGAGHLLSFTGTDTVPALLFAEAFYNANMEEELIGASIPATEHTVMCSNGQDEYETIKRLITEVYPSGFVSIVCDTWNFFNVLTNVLPRLKDEIMARDGKVVVRPDSGDPVDIICGEWGYTVRPRGEEISIEDPESKGAFQILWELFGGTVNEKGYKVLDPHIGLIYGDSISLDRADQIGSRLESKGFAFTVVLGIGSFSYQYTTRDTFGFKLGATWVEIDGEGRNIFKDPATDLNHMKKSLTGRVQVLKNDNGKLYVVDGMSLEEWLDRDYDADQLKQVFVNGQLVSDQSFSDIRARVLASLDGS